MRRAADRLPERAVPGPRCCRTETGQKPPLGSLAAYAQTVRAIKARRKKTMVDGSLHRSPPARWVRDAAALAAAALTLGLIGAGLAAGEAEARYSLSGGCDIHESFCGGGGGGGAPSGNGWGVPGSPGGTGGGGGTVGTGPGGGNGGTGSAPADGVPSECTETPIPGGVELTCVATSIGGPPPDPGAARERPEGLDSRTGPARPMPRQVPSDFPQHCEGHDRIGESLALQYNARFEQVSREEVEAGRDPIPRLLKDPILRDLQRQLLERGWESHYEGWRKTGWFFRCRLV
jgi:hypothetical protein